MTQATINGNTYSDDGTSARDMLNGGHRQWFLPLVGDTAAVAGQVQANADQVAIDTANAANSAASTRGTSSTSLSVAAGAKTLTTQANKQFALGSFVSISRTSAPSTLMHGVVTAYNTGTGAMGVSVGVVAGSGTYTDWTIALSGAQGAEGPSGNGQVVYSPKTAAYTLVTTDRGSLIDCTSGTFTLSFQAAATLGSIWDTTIRNTGTGVITLDPNGAELIDGAATFTLYPNIVIRLMCDGTQFRIYNEGPRFKRLPIFSAAAAVATAASNLEDITPPTYSTGMANVGNGVWGNSLFVFSSGSAQANIASSPDGITWTLRAMPSSQVWRIATNGSNRFLACAANARAVASSTNGTTWAAATALPANANADIQIWPAFNGSDCLIFGQTPSTAFLTTNNGASWGAQSLPAAANRALQVVGGLYWYWAGGTTAYTSATGLTGSWTARATPFSFCYAATKQADGSLGVSNGTTLWTTTDGINWTLRATGSLFPFLVNGVYAVFSNTASFPSKTLHNGAWTPRVCSESLSPFAQAYNGAGVLVADTQTAGMVARIDPAEYAATPSGTFV